MRFSIFKIFSLLISIGKRYNKRWIGGDRNSSDIYDDLSWQEVGSQKCSHRMFSILGLDLSARISR